jgi:hypothetical protein
MAILDENNLLSPQERDDYHSLLKTHGHEPHHFVLEVKEDQGSMDMNDIQYVIIIKTIATHMKSEKSKNYTSRAGSGTWLVEFEEDLKNRYFL